MFSEFSSGGSHVLLILNTISHRRTYYKRADIFRDRKVIGWLRRLTEIFQFKQNINFLALDVRFEMMKHCLLLMLSGSLSLLGMDEWWHLVQIPCDLRNLIFTKWLSWPWSLEFWCVRYCQSCAIATVTCLLTLDEHLSLRVLAGHRCFPSNRFLPWNVLSHVYC